MPASDPICPAGTAFAAAVDTVRSGHQSVADAAAALAGRLTDEELLWLLDGARGMREAFRAGRYEAGLMDAIDAVEALLAQHFPLGAGDANPNELSDRVDLR